MMTMLVASLKPIVAIIFGLVFIIALVMEVSQLVIGLVTEIEYWRLKKKMNKNN